MNHEEYLERKKALEESLASLEDSYLEEHGLAIGTPVIFLGKPDGHNKSSVGKIHHVSSRTINWDGRITHDILPAKKDGTPSKRGCTLYYCSKNHLQPIKHD